MGGDIPQNCHGKVFLFAIRFQTAFQFITRERYPCSKGKVSFILHNDTDLAVPGYTLVQSAHLSNHKKEGCVL